MGQYFFFQFFVAHPFSGQERYHVAMQLRERRFLYAVAKQHGYERQRGEGQFRVAAQAAFYDFRSLRRPLFGYAERVKFRVDSKPEFLSLFIGSHAETDELRRLPFQTHKPAYRHVVPFVFQPAPEVLVPGNATLYAYGTRRLAFQCAKPLVQRREHFHDSFVILRVQAEERFAYHVAVVWVALVPAEEVEERALLVIREVAELETRVTLVLHVAPEDARHFALFQVSKRGKNYLLEEYVAHHAQVRQRGIVDVVVPYETQSLVAVFVDEIHVVAAENAHVVRRNRFLLQPCSM